MKKIIVATILVSLFLIVINRFHWVINSDVPLGRKSLVCLNKLIGQSALIKTNQVDDIFSSHNIGKDFSERSKIRRGDQEDIQYKAIEKKAFLYGFPAKITFHVVDSKGNSVPNANISVTFANHQRNGPIKGTTDINGLFSAEDCLAEDIIFSVSKSSYYETFDRFWFRQRGVKCIENDRWIPWNPTLKIRLKEIRNPYISTYKRVDLSYPKRKKVAFDMSIGDWVAPLGKGVSSDFIMYYDSLVGNDNHKIKKLTITTPLSLSDGFVKLTKDVDSRFPFYYEAPTSGYRSTLNFERKRTANKIISNVSLGKDEYLVVRITREGKIHYGLLLDLEFGESGTKTNEAGLIFTYYFNSTPNDRNLEVDLSHASGRKNGS